MKTCKLCIVSGQVQGVTYRATTQRQAQALNVTGYAKNLPDGSVEILACGVELDVKALCDWLWEGPRLAQVSDVECSEVASQELGEFLIQ